MKVHQCLLAVSTRGRGLYDITGEVVRVVAESGVTSGLCTVFLPHTSASLVIQENADPSVLSDMARWMDGIAPERADYEHDAEGPDDMTSHIRSALTQTQLSIPIYKGGLALGTWQGVYLFEHRERPHGRSVILHLLTD